MLCPSHGIPRHDHYPTGNLDGHDPVGLRGPVIHAGAAETAIVLAVAKGLVWTDELELGVEGEVSTAELCSEGVRTITENDVLADPRTATAGEAICERVTEASVLRVQVEC